MWHHWGGVLNTQLISLLLLLAQSTSGGKEEKRLLDVLFNPNRTDHHNPLERPVSVDTEPLEVRFKVSLQQIIDVDEKNQILHTNIWLDLKWTDYHFQWEPSEYGGIDKLMIPPQKLWRPDILMYNSADDKFDGTYPTNIVISSTGNMLYVPPGMFKSTCSINITWFPFDEQVCELKFGSWTYDGGSIDLKLQCPEVPDPPPNCTENGYGDTDTFIENGEWDLIALQGKRNLKYYACCRFPYIDLTFFLKIRRRKLYYIFNLIVPCFLLSCLCLLSFIIPSDAGEKISFGVTILLSLSVFQMMVAEAMPSTSTAVPLIGMYFACIMVMCSLSVVFTVLVLNYHHASSDGKEPPKWVRVIICTWMARFMIMTPPESIRNHCQSKIDSTIPPSSSSRVPSRTFRESHQGRRTTHQRSRSSKRPHRNGGYTLDLDLRERSSKSLLANVLDLEDDIRPQQIISSASSATNGGFFHPSPPPGCMPGIGAAGPGLEMEASIYNPPPITNELIAIIRELQFITAKFRQEETDSVHALEWKFAARVVDRFCLVFFTLITVISTCAILFSAPNLFNPVKE